ncbi:ATP-grasp domain-containing protein [Streptococcus anginosus]|uniref:ATP-grasp domain-containing protein n=1 Tax=Streptococcus anginosus TaxID=1328 RepID=UPI002001A53E|nr:ATP-grasp domain-containing protein [Streptococcus anginosus]
MKKKTVLVVGGMKILHKTIKEMGFDIILLQDKNKLTVSSELYNLIIGVDFSMTEEILKTAVYIKEIFNYSFVGAFGELHQEMASMIADKTNIKFINLQSIKKSRNKYELRTALEGTVLGNVQYDLITSRNKNDILPKYNKFIIKPINSWGSSDIYNNPNNFDFLDKGIWMIEEFIDGEEFSIETLSQHGQHHIISITKKIVNNDFVEIGHMPLFQVPSELRLKITKSVEVLLDQIKFTDGVTHTELKIVDNNKIKIIETHTRMGGDYIPEMIEYSTGYGFIKNVVKSTFRIKIDNPRLITVQKHVAIWFICISRKGILKEYCLKSLDSSVIKSEIFYSVGDYFGGTNSSFNRFGYVIAEGKTAEEALGNAKRNAESILIRIEE